MNPFEYLKTLLPVIRKDTIQSELETLRKETSPARLSVFLGATEYYGGEALRNTHAQALAKRLNDQDRRWERSNYIPTLTQLLAGVPAKLAVLSVYVDKMQRDVTPESLNYQRATVIRYLEVLSFLVDFSNDLLLWTAYGEDLALDGKPNAAPLSGTPAERALFEKELPTFIQASKLLFIQAQDLEKALKALPDLEIDADGIGEAVSGPALDPLKMNFIAPRWNPIFHLRMDLAQHAVNRFHTRNEQARLAEYKLMELRQKKAGNPTDPKLQKAIDTYSKELTRLRFKNQQFLDKYVN